MKHVHVMQYILWHSTLFTEMAKERQPWPSNVYSAVDDSSLYEVDSLTLELNPAYKTAEDGLAFSDSIFGSDAPLSCIIWNEGAVTLETPRDGEDMKEGMVKAEGRVEDEEADVTYYTPMNADVQEDGVHSRAALNEARQGNMAVNRGDFNWGVTTIDAAYRQSTREPLVGEDGERDSDEEDSSYTAYI